MRTVVVIVLIALGAAGVLIAETQGEQGDREQDKETTLVEKASSENDVELKIRAEGNTLAGHALNLEVVLTNRGTKRVFHGHVAYYGDYRIVVEDEKGESVPFTRFGKLVLGTEQTEFTKFVVSGLDPGKSFSITFNLSRLFDLSIPGTYKVSVAKEMCPAGSGDPFTIEVEGLELTVSEPPLQVSEGKEENATGH